MKVVGTMSFVLTSPASSVERLGNPFLNQVRLVAQKVVETVAAHLGYDQHTLEEHRL